MVYGVRVLRTTENGTERDKMRHGTMNNNRRQRHRSNGGPRNGQPRMQVFDSNGPDVRIRGTAHQVAEKYMTLAKDSAASGDRILSESYLQHAEHYQRVINRWENEPGYSHGEHQQSFGDDSRFHQRQDRPQQEQQEEDLSLPSSILGADAKASPQAVVTARTPEAAAAE